MSSAINLEPCASSCGTGRRRRGFCVRHYTQHLASGAIPRVLHKDYLAGFWARVEKGSDDECWKWNGPTTRDGYGRINYKYQNKLAHQLSFFIHNGHWATNQVLHHCDNPPCTNPKHLYDGTPKENALDASRRNRRCPAHLRKPREFVTVYEEQKLTRKRRAAVIAGIERGWWISAIARRYKVTEHLVKKMARNLSLGQKADTLLEKLPVNV